jgi:hypothetical protein
LIAYKTPPTIPYTDSQAVFRIFFENNPHVLR